LSSHLCPCLPSGLLPSKSSDENFVCISHLFLACYMLRPFILPDLAILVIFGEVYKL